MPEVAEVAHVCALLRRNVLGFKIANATLRPDSLLFPALKGCSDPDTELATIKDKLTGSTINNVRRHGKYFWIRLNLLDSKDTAVLLMHFGMTGMIKIKNVHSDLVIMENGGDKKVLKQLEEEKKVKQEIVDEVKAGGEDKGGNPSNADSDNDDKETPWPPRFSKFELELVKGDQKYELAFIDPRRLGRVRLILGPEIQTDESLMNRPPLSELGPDYSKPKGIIKLEKFEYGDPDPDHHGRPPLTLEEFNQLILNKKKPLKALLLDQAFFAGVGNWVSDEICYQAHLHPGEVLSSKLNPDTSEIDPVVTRLYEALIYVSTESVKLEGVAGNFPKNWLMLYRWGKGRKRSSTTSEGHTLKHETIGGRTSAFVPELQKPLKRSISQNGFSKRKRTSNKPKSEPEE